MESQSAEQVLVSSYGSEQALGWAQVVSDLYRAVFGLPPFNASPAAVTDQRAHFPNLTERPGFRLTLASAGGAHVGFGYGFLLPADTRWWSGLEEPLPARFTAETGARTFAIIDYGVLPDWRDRGVGRAVHDELLVGSGAERATLAVRPTATETQAIYRRWGWRRVFYLDSVGPSGSYGPKGCW